MSPINIGEKPAAINDDLHTLFSISSGRNDTISQTKFFESINSTIVNHDKIIYSEHDILKSPEDEAIIICIPSDLSGISKSISDKYGILSLLKRLKLKPGDCFVVRNSRKVLCLITKTRHSDAPSLSHNENSFRKLHEHAN
jgi:hypothetical protein